jgi:S-DNA-T family DNA segregation ATPase FtsK/SpoIIIE
MASARAADTGLQAVRRRALEALRAEKLQEVSALAGHITHLESARPFPHAGPVVSQASGAWILAPTLAQAFDEAARAAREPTRPQPKRTLRDQLFGEAGATLRPRRDDGLATMCSVVARITAEVNQLVAEAEQLGRRREAEGRAVREQAERRLNATLRRHAAVQAQLPARLLPWADPTWASWNASASPSRYYYAGRLRPSPDTTLGDHGNFGRDVVIPHYVRPMDGLHLVTEKATRPAAHALVRALITRLLATHRPGTLHLTVFDALGLGQSVAPFLELAEYDKSLLGGKVWSNGADFRVKLAELTAHIELVIQKYLRSDYPTLAAFNAAAGEIAAPYRFLVVFDFPAHFDADSFGELRRIIEAGARCGVGVLLVTNRDDPLPPGVDLASFPPTLTRISMGVPFTFTGSGGANVAFDFEPDSDRAIPADLLERIVRQTGSEARGGQSNNLTFEKVFGLFVDEAMRGVRPSIPTLSSRVDVADESTYWTQTTLEGITAPIGQRGARDVAALRFDSSDHAGALLVGRPGSGKSTLLHTYIAGLTTLYGPDELELHLIDFKEGVEFKLYAANGLPHARSVAIESDREFGVSVLESIQAELSRRAALLRGTQDSHSSFEALRRATGDQLPRILLVFDEFQVLFARSDKIGMAAAELLETLVRQGRGFGIHVLLGSQSLSGLDALGSHVPQLLPVRILLPSAEADAFKVLGESNTEGASLTTAGDGILNTAGGAVEANERFRGALIDNETRRARVRAMREKADREGFARRPVVFEGNAPIQAEDTAPRRFIDEVRTTSPHMLRLRFGTPMALTGTGDVDLRREAGANMLVVARDTPVQLGASEPFSVPPAIISNAILSAVAQGATVELVDFLPVAEGLDAFAASLSEAGVAVTRRRQLPDLMRALAHEVDRRISSDDTMCRTTLLVMYGMHRARDFDEASFDHEPGADLGALLLQILRDGPEVGVHTVLWAETIATMDRRVPSGASREMSWRVAGQMSAEDSLALIDSATAGSLREQQVVVTNDDRGIAQRCTTISAPGCHWVAGMLERLQDDPQGGTR